MVVKEKESLNYLLGENWCKIRVLHKHKQRDFIDYTVSHPVTFTFKPTDDFFIFSLTSLKKENMMGQVQWDTRYGRKDPPVEDGEEAEEAEMDSIFFE